jgi:hypothetical protein
MCGPRQRVEFPTKKAAERHLAETSHKVARGEYIVADKTPTFGKVAESWAQSKADRRPS